MAITIRPLRTDAAPPFVAGEAVALSSDADGSALLVTRQTGNRGALTTIDDVASGRTLVAETSRASLARVGRRAAVCGTAGDVAIVDLDGDRRRPLASAGGVDFVGSRLAWWFADDAIVSWDTVSGAEKLRIPQPPTRANVPGAHRPSFWSAAELPDGRTLAFLDARFDLHLLDLEEGGSVRIRGGPKEVPSALLVSRDGTRALGLGSRGACVLFDLVLEEAIVSVPARSLFIAAPKHSAWLDDGRLVVPSTFLDVVSFAPVPSARSIGARDEERESIHGIAALTGSLVVVLLNRITDPARPHVQELRLEVWDVDDGRLVTSIAARSTRGPLLFVPPSRLFAIERAPEMRLQTRWVAYELAGLPPIAPAPPRSAKSSAAKVLPKRRSPAKRRG